MALILAVEPDSRQATNLTKVLSLRPRTELVIAESAARALQTLADRVPDVLLTSPLLSRQDEVVLAGWLRDLGPAAAHVQELTIPILAQSAPPPRKKRSVLATLRRDQRQAKPDGCEPDMFAEQISVYAERATAGRKYEPPPPVDLLLLAPTEHDFAPAEISAAVEAPFTDERTLWLAFDADPVDLGLDDDRIALILLPPPEHDLVATSREPIEQTATFRDELTLPLVFDSPVVEVEEAWVAIELDDLFEEPCEEPEPIVPEDVWVLGPIESVDELIKAAAPRPVAQAAPTPPPAPMLAPPPVPVLAPPPVVVAPPPAPAPTPAPVAVAPSPAAVAAPPPAPMPQKKKAAKPKAKPAQDEWGLFDPEQCGFAALLAKLDEITEHKDGHQQAPGTTVRVLAY